MNKNIAILAIVAVVFVAGCTCGKSKGKTCTMMDHQVDKTAVQDSQMKAEAQGVPVIEGAQQNAEVPVAIVE